MEDDDNWRQQMRDDDERAEMQATIDALVAAAIDAHKQIAAEWGKNHSRLDKLNAALALARGEK